MKGWITRALIIALIVIVIQVISGTTYGGLGILVALVVGFASSGIAEGVSKLISGKKK